MGVYGRRRLRKVPRRLVRRLTMLQKPVRKAILVSITLGVYLVLTNGLCGAEKDVWELPTADFRVVRRPTKVEGESELWAVSNRTPDKQSLVFRYSRSGDVVLSPDGSFIAFNYHHSSTDSTVLLFRRKEAVQFELLENLDLSEMVKGFYEQTANQRLGLDHYYIDCLAWSSDSHAILLKAYGHSAAKTINAWFCIYSLSTKQLSFDLHELNK